MVSPAVGRVELHDLSPAGDHVGLGAASHLYGDVLVVAGQEDGDALHVLVLPGDGGGRVASGLAVQGEVGPGRAVGVGWRGDDGWRLQAGTPVLHTEHWEGGRALSPH